MMTRTEHTQGIRARTRAVFANSMADTICHEVLTLGPRLTACAVSDLAVIESGDLAAVADARARIGTLHTLLLEAIGPIERAHKQLAERELLLSTSDRSEVPT